MVTGGMCNKTAIYLITFFFLGKIILFKISNALWLNQQLYVDLKNKYFNY